MPTDSYARQVAARTADLASTASGKGAALIGARQSGNNMRPQTVFEIMKRGEVWLTDHSSADASGAADSSAALSDVASEAAASSRRIKLPKGTFKLNSGLVIPPGGIVIEGMGEDSVLKSGAANLNLLSAVSTGKVVLQNLRLEGDGTSNAYASGCGLRARNTDVELDWVYLVGFGGHGICAQIDDPAHFGLRHFRAGVVRAWEGRNPRDAISYTGVDDGYGNIANGNENADILITGGYRSIRIGSYRGETTAAPSDGSIAVGNGILIATTAALGALGVISIGSVEVSGHRKRGLTLANNMILENVSRDPIVIGEVVGKNIGWQLVKTKFLPNISIGNVVGRNIEDRAVAGAALPNMATAGWPNGYFSPEVKGTLQGAVMINGTENVSVGSVVIDNSGGDGGTDALLLNGNNYGIGGAGNPPIGTGRDNCTIGRVIAVGCAGAAVSVKQSVRHSSVGQVIAEGCRHAVYIALTNNSAAQSALHFGHVKSRLSTAQGIVVLGTAAYNIGKVLIESVDIDSSVSDGINVQYADEFVIAGGSVLNSGWGNAASTSIGLNIADVRVVDIKGVRSENTGENVSQRTGFRLSGAMASYAVLNCTSGLNKANAAGTNPALGNGNRVFPIDDTTTGTPTKRIWGGIGLLERAGLTVAPGVIAAGAIFSTAEITLNGLEPGDRVDVTSSLIDDNFEMWAVASSAGKFIAKVRNRSAGALNPGTITYGVRGTKQRNV